MVQDEEQPHMQEVLPDRTYLFNILYTIDPNFVLDKIIQVQKIKVVENKEEKDEVIIIKKDLLKQISESNYFQVRINIWILNWV